METLGKLLYFQFSLCILKASPSSHQTRNDSKVFTTLKKTSNKKLPPFPYLSKTSPAIMANLIKRKCQSSSLLRGGWTQTTKQQNCSHKINFTMCEPLWQFSLKLQLHETRWIAIARMPLFFKTNSWLETRIIKIY